MNSIRYKLIFNLKMVDRRQCKRCCKRPYFNHPGLHIGIYCKSHSLPGMINVMKIECDWKNCTTSPTFNYSGHSKYLYCKKHALPGMINVKDRRCQKYGCMTISNFNYESEKIGLYCYKHKEEGMINIHNSKRKRNRELEKDQELKSESEEVTEKKTLTDAELKRQLEKMYFEQNKKQQYEIEEYNRKLEDECKPKRIKYCGFRTRF